MSDKSEILEFNYKENNKTNKACGSLSNLSDKVVVQELNSQENKKANDVFGSLSKHSDEYENKTKKASGNLNKHFKWSAKMIEDLIESIQAYKSSMFENLDFYADKQA